MSVFDLLPIDRDTAVDEAEKIVDEWVAQTVPAVWQEAARTGGRAALHKVRTPADYDAWYPQYARSGLVAPTWPRQFGGLGVGNRVSRAIEARLAPYNLVRRNQLGLTLAGPTILTFGTDEQKARLIPPIVTAEQIWCQFFSEPGAGSDLASLATRAVRDGYEWVLTGQKVWSTQAMVADYAICLARTDPDAPKRAGITYFLLNMRQPGLDVRPLRTISGEEDFAETFIDGARVPDRDVLGEVNDGWRLANATLSGERLAVSGPGSGGQSRIGSGTERLIERAQESGQWSDRVVRQQLMRLWTDEQIVRWTNARVRDTLRAGRPPGPEASVGKLMYSQLNQRVQTTGVNLLGSPAMAWEEGHIADYVVLNFLHSRAETIAGGTTEVQRNIVGERALGLPREPDPYKGLAWKDVPR